DEPGTVQPNQPSVIVQEAGPTRAGARTYGTGRKSGELMSGMDYAVVGNCTVASIIDPRARHVWFCYPRLDGDPLFNALVNGDSPSAGFMDVDVVGFTSSTQRYLRNNAVLETILTGEH